MANSRAIVISNAGKLITIPIGTTVATITSNEWDGYGAVPTVQVLDDALDEIINITRAFDSLPNPTQLEIDFGAPTTSTHYVKIT